MGIKPGVACLAAVLAITSLMVNFETAHATQTFVPVVSTTSHQFLLVNVNTGAVEVIEQEPETEPEPEPVEVEFVPVVDTTYEDSKLGNIHRVYDFLTKEFADTRSYFTDELGISIPSDRPAINWSPLVAISICANAVAESECSQKSQNNWLTSQDSNTVINSLISTTGGGRAYGIIQWDGGRRTNFGKFCRTYGLDPLDVRTGCLFLAYEYYTTSEYANYYTMRKMNDSSLTLENAIKCAEKFRAEVERGGTYDRNTPILKNWGNKWDYAWGDKPSGGLFEYLA